MIDLLGKAASAQPLPDCGRADTGSLGHGAVRRLTLESVIAERGQLGDQCREFPFHSTGRNHTRFHSPAHHTRRRPTSVRTMGAAHRPRMLTLDP